MIFKKELEETLEICSISESSSYSKVNLKEIDELE